MCLLRVTNNCRACTQWKVNFVIIVEFVIILNQGDMDCSVTLTSV